VTAERLEGSLFVDDGAALETPDDYYPSGDQAPWIAATVASLNAAPGTSLEVSLRAEDDQSLSRYVLWIEGVEGSQLEVPIAGGATQDARAVTYTIPAALPLGTHLLGVGVYDGAGQRTATAYRIVVASGSNVVVSAPATSRAPFPSPLRSDDRDVVRPAARGAGPRRAETIPPRSHD